MLTEMRMYSYLVTQASSENTIKSLKQKILCLFSLQWFDTTPKREIRHNITWTYHIPFTLRAAVSLKIGKSNQNTCYIDSEEERLKVLAESFSLSCLCHDYEGKEVKCGLQVFGLRNGNEVVGKNANTQIYIPSPPWNISFILPNLMWSSVHLYTYTYP